MNKGMKEAVVKCEICAAFQAKNVKQPMQTHEIPDRPWSRVSSDLFTLNCKERVVLADSCSDFIEVGELKGTTANYIIEFLKEQFSRHGIPDALVTDNGRSAAAESSQSFPDNGDIITQYMPNPMARPNPQLKWQRRFSRKLTETKSTRGLYCWINGTHQHKVWTPAQYRDWCPAEHVHCYRYQQIFCTPE